MTTQEESLEKRIAAAAEKEARAAKRAEELRAEAAKLRAKRELLEAKKLQLLVKADRAEETRKKILAGAAFLKAVENGQINKLTCRSILERFLTREQDRALFKELWEVPATATPPQKSNLHEQMEQLKAEALKK